MNLLKKSLLPQSLFSLIALFFFFATPVFSLASADPIQTIAGEIMAQGVKIVNLGENDVDWRKSWEAKNNFINDDYHYGGGDYSANVSYKLIGNTIYIYANSAHGYTGTFGALTLDDKGNFVSFSQGSLRPDFFLNAWMTTNSIFCQGDDENCKKGNYTTIKINETKSLICSFDCNQTNKYKYGIVYESMKQGTYSTLNSNTANKCETIRVKFSPQAEWFGSLAHTCGYQGGDGKIFTIDTISPPTDMKDCTGQESCLTAGQEYSLTSTTWGKGVQKNSTDFVQGIEKSLASDSQGIECREGLCTPQTAGAKTLSLTIPETSYYGQCRGSATSETVEGKIITSPAVTINTEEAKIPAANSTLDINVQNRPPVSTVTFEKKYMSEGETTKVYCDVIDPDSCSDKIVKIKWKCMDSQGKTDNCFFLDNNSIFKQGELYKEITPANPYRDTVDLKLNKKETYAVTCEAWDNDNANTLSGAGINSIKVTDPVCIADGTCNGKCPGDPDCGVIPAGSCYITRIKPAFDIKKIKPNTKVTFEAKLFGSVAPTKYTWFCDKNDTTQEEITSADKTINHTCTNYTLDNHIYEPKVVVTYSDGTTKECINNEGTAVTTDGIAPNQVGFCTVVPDEGGTDNSTCGDETNAKFKVYTNQDLNNPTYEWSNCPGSQNQPNVTCNYKTTQLSEKFTPSLIIKDGGETIKCPSNTSITLYKEAACKVLSRVKNSGEEYVKNPASRVTDVLESKIERKCIDPKEAVTWETIGAAIQSSDNDKAQTPLNAAGNVTIKAKVKVGDKFVNCEESSTDVKQKLEEGI